MSTRAPRVSAGGRLAGAAVALGWLAAAFGGAGTLRWGSGWCFVAVLVAGLLAHRAYVARRNPALLERRARVGDGTKRWDLAWVAAFWPLMAAVPATAGAELVRAGGRPWPGWTWPLGAALFAAGMTISARAMAVNPFFEGTVRLQPGQTVVQTGPYARVRHPGYVGLALWALAMPLLLRSRWAAAPAVVAAGWVVLRTALEDRVLRRELPGYRAYAARVRHRLVPGLW